jgi:hypothetical protein
MRSACVDTGIQTGKAHGTIRWSSGCLLGILGLIQNWPEQAHVSTVRGHKTGDETRHANDRHEHVVQPELNTVAQERGSSVGHLYQISQFFILLRSRTRDCNYDACCHFILHRFHIEFRTHFLDYENIKML